MMACKNNNHSPSFLYFLRALLIISLQASLLNIIVVSGDVDYLENEILAETLKENDESLEEQFIAKSISEDTQTAAKAEQEALEESQIRHTSSKKLNSKYQFQNSPQQGANDLMKKKMVRDKISPGSRRSRVPQSSLPSNQGEKATFGDVFSFEDSSEETTEAPTPSPDDDEKRQASWAQLDEPTRMAMSRAVSEVMKASGDGESVYNDHGGGTWYKVLGLRHGETDVTRIKQQYRRLALALHPDKNFHPDAPQAFDILQRGYKALSIEANRLEYDRKLVKRAKVRRQRVWNQWSNRLQSANGLVSYVWRKVITKFDLVKKYLISLVILVLAFG